MLTDTIEIIELDETHRLTHPNAVRHDVIIDRNSLTKAKDSKGNVLDTKYMYQYVVVDSKPELINVQDMILFLVSEGKSKNVVRLMNLRLGVNTSFDKDNDSFEEFLYFNYNDYEKNIHTLMLKVRRVI